MSTQTCPERPTEHLLVVSPLLESLATISDPNLHSRVIQASPAGSADAFNRGLEQAKGELVGCLSDDDVYLAGTLERVQTIFEDHPEVDLVYGGIEQIDEDSVAYRRRIPRQMNKRRLIRKCTSWHPSLFFRRRVLDQVGMLDRSLEYCYWYDFVIRCYQEGLTSFCVKDCLSGKRRHRGNRQFGVTSLAVQTARAMEQARLMSRHLGAVPDRVALRVGHYHAAQQEIDPLSAGYDAAVLKNALKVKQSLDAADQAQTGIRGQAAKIRLHVAHIRVQASHSLKYPRVLTRFMPNYFGPRIRNFFRSRLFQLQQHAPRAVRLINETPQVPSTGRLSIGIVTPNYNTGEFLQRTIESVVRQQFPLLQYVVQDGGSTDSSVEVIQRYAKQLHHWDSSPDSGQTQAINRGIRHIDTDIMAYLNSDDILLPGSLSFVSEYFRRNPKVDVIYGHRLIIDGNDQEIGRWILPKHDDHAIKFADYIPQETMFWRRSAWNAVGASLDESFQFAMDWDLILRFRAAGMNFVRVPRFLGAFRVIETQKTQVLLETLGATEMNRLRRRELGHIPTSREMRRAIRPYRFRQWVQHHTHTLLEPAVR